LAIEILLVRRWLRILIKASVKLRSDDTVQRGQRSKQETKREPCPYLSFVVLVCSRLSSGNLDPGPDFLHRLGADGETVDGQSHPPVQRRGAPCLQCPPWPSHILSIIRATSQEEKGNLGHRSIGNSKKNSQCTCCNLSRIVPPHRCHNGHRDLHKRGQDP